MEIQVSLSDVISMYREKLKTQLGEDFTSMQVYEKDTEGNLVKSDFGLVNQFIVFK